MGLPRIQLIAVADRVLSPELSNWGYELDAEPGIDEHGLIFLYMKEPCPTDQLYRIISLQPSGFDADGLFDLAVNLSRWTTRRGPGPEKDHYPQQIAHVRLAPCLWEKGGAMDLWWHFLSESEYEEACKDILDKLVRYGIPFLNDPDSSFETWYERGTGRKLP
jgi:hypothetical protein